MNQVRGQDSPGVGWYSFHNHTLSNSVNREKGFARISEKRFLEERLRQKKYKNSYYLSNNDLVPIPPFHSNSLLWGITIEKAAEIQ